MGKYYEDVTIASLLLKNFFLLLQGIVLLSFFQEHEFNIVTNIMCTFNFSISDMAIDRIRPAFKDDIAMHAWLQDQLEILVMQFNETSQGEKKHTHSLSHLRGIFAESNKTSEQLRDEYLNKKYGV